MQFNKTFDFILLDIHECLFYIRLSNFLNFRYKVRPAPGFQGFEGEIRFKGGKIFVFVVCLKQTFLGTKKFGEVQKKFRGPLPTNAPRGFIKSVNTQR